MPETENDEPIKEPLLNRSVMITENEVGEKQKRKKDNEHKTQ